VIPLAIVYAHKPAWSLPAGVTVAELFRHPGARPPSLDWDRRRCLLEECVPALVGR